MATTGIRPLAHAPVLREQVYEALEELIISGVLQPGQRLTELELAQQLNVSRNPVREALTLLARSGWVDLRPRHGAHVHQPTDREVEDFYRVRTVLEAESARLAAQEAASDDIVDLQALCERGLEALARQDEAAAVDANSAFHRRVAVMADNRVLSEMLALIEKRVRWYFGPVVRIRGRASWDEHAALLAAVADQNGDHAAAVMRAHCEATAATYRTRPRTQP